MFSKTPIQQIVLVFEIPEVPAFAVVVESPYFGDIGVMLIKIIREHQPKLLFLSNSLKQGFSGGVTFGSVSTIGSMVEDIMVFYSFILHRVSQRNHRVTRR